MADVPPISILLPTFNGASFLREQLDSILVQTWSDFELVAIDDDSSDVTPAILAEYAGRDHRIRVLPSTGNRGQNLRLLECFRAARGPLIAISDQDDVWHPAKLARLHQELGPHNLAFGRSELIDAGGTALGVSLSDLPSHTPAPGDRLNLLFRSQVSGHGLIARRDMIGESAFQRFQPFDWLISLVSIFSEGGMVYVDDAIVRHRIHDSNQMNREIVGDRLDLRRLTPGRLYAQLVATRRSRLNLVERLEHVAYSEAVPESTRKALGSAAWLCRSAWFDPGASWGLNDARLAERLLGLLEPLAGSEGDLIVAREQISALTRAQLHPLTLLRSARSFAGY
jgi:glycosyltransferase involved in cell wall biosynthesis